MASVDVDKIIIVIRDEPPFRNHTMGRYTDDTTSTLEVEEKATGAPQIPADELEASRTIAYLHNRELPISKFPDDVLVFIFKCIIQSDRPDPTLFMKCPRTHLPILLLLSSSHTYRVHGEMLPFAIHHCGA